MQLPVLPEAHLAIPEVGNGTGALVLSGSSGRVETARADLLAQSSGAHVLTYRWFGVKPLPPAVYQYPLEDFDPAIDFLVDNFERVVLIGNSRSTEAMFLKAAGDPRIAAVIAFAPSHAVWAGMPGEGAPDGPQRSAWTRGGDRVPFVPFDLKYRVKGDPPEYRGAYEQSLLTSCEIVPDCVIPVEEIVGEVLLVAGGDDKVWPSVENARWIELTRSFYERVTTVITDPTAGHRVILPGEAPVVGGQVMARGGTETSDRALGAKAWPEILRVLGKN